MNKRIFFSFLGCLVILIVAFLLSSKKEEETRMMEATVISKNDENVMLQDVKNVIYTFNIDDIDAKPGNSLVVNYKGKLNKNKETQDSMVVGYKVKSMALKDGIPVEWLDDGLFRDYYTVAYEKLKTMSLDEKIAQLLLVHYPNSNGTEILKQLQFGGYIFFEKDFKDKTKKEVQTMIEGLQKEAKIPILTAVDEEGGRVVRISSNPNLANNKFKSPSELYVGGGFSEIKNDTIEKSMVLNNLGINLNLAPVVDVSTNSNDYIYERTLKEDTKLTAEYAKAVIEASKGMHVSYTLKHFPGYGGNIDTHTSVSMDNRTYQEIVDDALPPFESGINTGAEAVLVSHNTVTSIDNRNPASLSPSVHNLLRNSLNFTGIAITDDLSMGALDSIDNKVVKALLAGNDLIITADYEDSINSIKMALRNDEISENLVDKLAFRVLAWKYYKGLIMENQK